MAGGAVSDVICIGVKSGFSPMEVFLYCCC